MLPSIRLLSTASRPGVPPRRPLRSPLRSLARLCSSRRTGSIAAPTAGGAYTRVVWSRGRGWRGGAARSSRLHPALAENLFARRRFSHALSGELAYEPLLLEGGTLPRPEVGGEGFG